MKKHKKRRLMIASETIRQLEVKELLFDHLQAVVGGSGNVLCSKGAPGTCSTDPQ